MLVRRSTFDKSVGSKRRLDFEKCSTWSVALILQTVQENSSSLHGLQNITTCSAFVDGTSSSSLKELVICGANNEECLRSGLQKCLTSRHFIAAAEGLSSFFSKFPGLVELGKRHGVQEFFSPKRQKNCFTNHTNCYTIQFSCRRNFRVCYAKF